MTRYFILLLIMFSFSCGESRPTLEDPQLDQEITSITHEDLQSAEIEKESQDKGFTANYSIEGVPTDIFREAVLELSFGYVGLDYIEYRIGCEGEFEQHFPEDPLQLDFTNYHAPVQLCLRGIDSNAVVEDQERVYKWIQGYPKIVNHTFKSDCEFIDDRESFHLAIRLIQEEAGTEIVPVAQNEIYNNDVCAGVPDFVIGLVSENFKIEGEFFHITIDGQQWILRMIFNKVAAIQHFEVVEGPFNSTGKAFVFTDPLSTL